MSIFISLLFLFWPFGALLSSFKFYDKKTSKNIIWLFVIFYGFTFVVSNDTMDANRIREKFEYISSSNFSYIELINYYFLDNPDGADFLQPTVFFILSKMSHNFYVLMSFLGLIFGFFYSRNICYLIDNAGKKILPYNNVVLFLSFVIIGFWDINLFRFASASMIFVYGTIPYLYEGKKKRLWIVPFSFLMHFTFLFPSLVLLIYFIFRNKVTLYFIVFIMSFLLVSINVSALGDVLLSFLPSNLHYKINAYTNEDYVAEQAGNIKSMSFFLRYLTFFMINLFFTVFYVYYRRDILLNKQLGSLFCFTLLFMAAANFISIIPSGNRFLSVSALFSLSFIFFFFQTYGIPNRFKILINLSVPIFLLSSLGYIRLGLNTIDIITLIGNPVIAFFNDTRVAIVDFVF